MYTKTSLEVENRNVFLYHDPTAKALLIQPVDDHDQSLLDQEVETIRSLAKDKTFSLCAFAIHDWNKELSPWEAPPVFGKEGFGEGAKDTLAFILQRLLPALKEKGFLNEDTALYLGGYSLAGLFSLWAGYQTDVFHGVAGVSPSVWFPDWISYCQNHRMLSQKVYLSLGNKEEKTRNQVMARVGDNIRQMEEILLKQKETDQGNAEETALSFVRLEWNHGNHFVDSDLRTAKGFYSLLAQG